MDSPHVEDARRGKRIAIGLPVTLQYVEQNKEIKHRCVTVDLSPFGVRVRVPGGLAAGQNLRILPDDRVGTSIPGRIVWVVSTKQEYGAQAGIEFLEPLHLPA
jgi:hypothetical protein